MAKSLDQILSELNPQYQSSQDLINTQLSAIPEQTQNGIAQADAKLASANTNILNSARTRGTGVAFGGIPLSEQANYAATQYAPAIANLQTAQNDKQVSLAGQLAQLNRDKSTQARSIYDTGVAQDFQQQQFQEQIRQFNEQQSAARAASAASSYSFGGGANNSQQTNTAGAIPKISRTANGGFNFSDAYGSPVNAAEYARLYQSQGGSLSYRQLLQRMANDGDGNAKIALNYVGDDAKFGNAPQQFRGALAAVGATGSFQGNTTNSQPNVQRSLQSTSIAPKSNFLTLGNFQR